jgi:hypothetical protein
LKLIYFNYKIRDTVLDLKNFALFLNKKLGLFMKLFGALFKSIFVSILLASVTCSLPAMEQEQKKNEVRDIEQERVAEWKSRSKAKHALALLRLKLQRNRTKLVRCSLLLPSRIFDLTFHDLSKNQQAEFMNIIKDVPAFSEEWKIGIAFIFIAMNMRSKVVKRAIDFAHSLKGKQKFQTAVAVTRTSRKTDEEKKQQVEDERIKQPSSYNRMTEQWQCRFCDQLNPVTTDTCTTCNTILMQFSEAAITQQIKAISPEFPTDRSLRGFKTHSWGTLICLQGDLLRTKERLKLNRDDYKLDKIPFEVLLSIPGLTKEELVRIFMLAREAEIAKKEKESELSKGYCIIF